MIHKRLFGVVVLIAGLAAGPAMALPSGSLDFTVLRDGSRVGTHEINVKRSGDEIRVDIATSVAVKLAFVTVYRFEHEGYETWKNGKLVEIASKTDDDGTDKSLHGEMNGKGLAIDGSAHDFVADPGIIPASLWNPDIVKQDRLLNTLDGSEMEVKTAFVGNETVAVHGQQVPAKHYKITGQLQRELWFDGDGTLVQVRFKASDNSDIQYVLK